MHIVRLEAENVKILKAITIEPDPENNLVVIGGRNEQGKSSTLDAIEWALAGKAAIPGKPVRSGKKKARMVCDLGTLVVERRISQKSDILVVKRKVGERGLSRPLNSPQKILNELIGKLSFDPQEFVNLDAPQQFEMLRDLVGLDFQELNSKRRKIYDDRTEVNREVTRLKSKLEGLTLLPAVPTEEVSIAKLLAEKKSRSDHNETNKKARERINTQQEAIERSKKDIEQDEKKIRALELELARKKADLDQAISAHEQALESVKSLKDKDEAEIDQQLQELEKTNKKVRSNQEYRETKKLLTEAESTASKLTDKIQAIDDEKQTQLQEAKFPVDGLTFKDDIVMLNDIPFKQASSAAQLRVSLAMAIAKNPKLKIVLIRDGCRLDDDSIAMIAKMAKESGHQVWLERVGTGDECQVIIEEGEVAEVRRPRQPMDGDDIDLDEEDI